MDISTLEDASAKPRLGGIEKFSPGRGLQMKAKVNH